MYRKSNQHNKKKRVRQRKELEGCKSGKRGREKRLNGFSMKKKGGGGKSD